MSKASAMIGRTRAGKRAEQFAALIDGRPTERDPSIGLVEFAGVVSTLRDIEPLEMRPEFAETLRARLMLEAPERLADLSAATAGDSGRPLVHTAPKRVRLARVAAVTCLVVGVTGGVAAASQSALPGDPLYGVKRGIERAQVSFAGSDATEGQRLVSQASTRLDEVEDLAVSRPDDDATTRLIEQTLADFSDQATDGAGALISSYENDSDESSIAALRDFTNASAADLDALSSVIPASARDDLLDAARVLSDLDQDARDVCADCSSLAPLGISDKVQELAAAARNLLNLPSSVIPDNDPGGDTVNPRQDPQGGGADDPTKELPSGLLPSLPALTQAPPDNDAPIKPGSTSTPDPGGETSTPAPLLPDLPLPSIPLPSLPLLDGLIDQ
jgi:hypothetical protein